MIEYSCVNKNTTFLHIGRDDDLGGKKQNSHNWYNEYNHESTSLEIKLNGEEKGRANKGETFAQGRSIRQPWRKETQEEVEQPLKCLFES